MTDARTDSDVLVVGAGPVGLTAALELRRRGIDVTVVDRSAEPMQYAKAVGVQPRTLEIWDTMGVVRPALSLLGRALRVGLSLCVLSLLARTLLARLVLSSRAAKANEDCEGRVRKGAALRLTTVVIP